MTAPLNFEKRIVKVGSCCNWLTIAVIVVLLNYRCELLCLLKVWNSLTDRFLRKPMSNRSDCWFVFLLSVMTQQFPGRVADVT